MYKKTNKGIVANILKWVLIIGLIAFACVKYKKFMLEAIDEVSDTSTFEVIICFLLANLYFLAEGSIISKMTGTGEVRLTLFQGMSCAYMCAFYRLTTLGSGNGIAQLYYYNTKGISVSRATGMSLAQYTFQKITIGLMGIISFICVVLLGNSQLLKYSGYMLAGVIAITGICLFLFLITVSKKISDLLMRFARKIIKEKSRFYRRLDKAENYIDNLQEQGGIVWRDKKLFIYVIILNMFKFSCWYAIPGVLFIKDYNVNLVICLALMAVCNMLGSVMVAPSGVGTLDFVFAILFATIIHESDAVAAGVVLYRLFTWVVPFIIGLIPAAFLRKINQNQI